MLQENETEHTNDCGQKNLTVFSNSEEMTEYIGSVISSLVFGGCFICLFGDMGAGKTAFTRGLAAALGDSHASSPTFSIVHEYDTSPPMFHFDAYRLHDEDDLDSVGYEDYLLRTGVIVMEWPERVEGVLPKDRLDISFQTLDDQTRKIEISTRGSFPPFNEEMASKKLSKCDLRYKN